MEISELVGDNTSQQGLKWAIIDSPMPTTLSNNPNILYEGNFYETEDGKEVGVSHLIYAKIIDPSWIDDFEWYAEFFDFQILGYNEHMPQWYTVALTNRDYFPDTFDLIDYCIQVDFLKKYNLI